MLISNDVTKRKCQVDRDGIKIEIETKQRTQSNFFQFVIKPIENRKKHRDNNVTDESNQSYHIYTLKMRLESIDCVAHTYSLARVHTLLGNRQLRCQSQSSVATENARKKITVS